MELKAFVSDTLQQLAEGIKEAQSAVAKTGGSVNPEGITYERTTKCWDRDTGDPIQEVAFEMALTSSTDSQDKVGVGFMAGMMGAGAQMQDGTSHPSVGTISFVVPMVFPRQARSGR